MTEPTGDRPAANLRFRFGLVCWSIGFAWFWFRATTWVFDFFVVPMMLVVYLGGLAAVVVGVHRWRRAAAAIAVTVALAVPTILVNPGWAFAPRLWFALHRPLFERTLSTSLSTDPGDGYYGAQLPWALRFLAADGKVSNSAGMRFYPQWIGIPDDAGGYFYSPGRSPDGVDMFGLLCQHPVDLGGGWWMCGLRNNGM